MSNEYRDDQRRGGVRGEDAAEDIIDACEPICYVRNPIIPHPTRANSWWEKDFLVYTRQEHLFCIETKTYRGTISYPRRARTVSPGKRRPPQSSSDNYDYSHIVQEKAGETPLVKPNPLERTRQYIPHLKAYLHGVNPRLQDLPIIPVAAFSPKGDISAIHDMEHGMLYFHELPAFFRRYARSARVPYPSLWVEQALLRVPTWDKIRFMNSYVWIHGILVDRELTFMGPDGQYIRLPYAQIAAVGLQRDEPVSLYTTFTVRYVGGGTESFPCVEGQLQLTHLGKSQTYDLNMVSRILVGIANKFLSCTE